jgi:2-aminoethylphosphonate-pyruvate transaminase
LETNLPPARDKLLFTPGPATTSQSVKEAMLHDVGSWHSDFNAIVADVRERLLALAGVSREDGYECILMQGSGTFGVEAVISSVVPRDGKLLVLANGAYGERILRMTGPAAIDAVPLRHPHDTATVPNDVAAVLAADSSITHVAIVHCETTTGIMNPIEEIGRIVRDAGRSYIVDAMSSFGAMPIGIQSCGIDYLVSSANKCLEGVPGLSFIIARRAALEATEGSARSLSLDILGQLRNFEATGLFRFTPPTHVILALRQAIAELEQEGGVAARASRYRHNHKVLVEGMCAMGFKPYLRPELQGYTITAFHFPNNPNFDFDRFYSMLADWGMIIYPGKLTDVACFRIGSIGRIFEPDVRQLLNAIRESMRELGCFDAQ